MATSAPPTKAFAASRRTAHSTSRSNPLLLWHLLSLDAPTVAALWTWFLARTNQIHLPASSIFAMAVAVWMLYAADRLLDTRSIQIEHELELEARHYFHRVHARAFLIGITASAPILAALLPRLYPESLRLYLILGAMLFAYFVLIHSAALSRRLPKELAVGVFFSAATFIPAISRHPELRFALLPAAILFAALCSLNCLFIYAWEHPVASPSTHPATRATLRFLPSLTAIASIAGLLLSIADPLLDWRIPTACALSAGLLLILHRARHRFTPTTLRAAADLCLLTPLLFCLR